jgi:hypothetical protein
MLKAGQTNIECLQKGEGSAVNRPSGQTMARMARALGVSREELTNWRLCKMSSEQKV